ncbi:MAG: hypothetical protein GY795_01700 [Desulfobacterales bacterium]|nr:hypothetical protein [Desulfobacterales bacterium]
MFHFAAPFALFALAAIPALAVIYLLQSRFKKQTVSTIMLWKNLSPVKQGGIRVRQFRLPFVFFIELFVIILLVMAAADPMVLSATKYRPLVVILDDSVSMRAREDSISFRDRGIRIIEDTIRTGHFRPVRFILAGKYPRTMAGVANTPGEALTILKNWNCYALSAELDKAVGMANEIGEKDAFFLVITDHAPKSEDFDDRIQWYAVGSPVPNTGFVSAFRSETEDKGRCLLEFANFSDKPAQTSLKIKTEQKSLQLGPRGQKRMIFNLPKTFSAISAGLGTDSLLEDNRVVLYPQPVKKTGVKISILEKQMRTLLSKAVEASSLAFSMSYRDDILFTNKKEMTPPNKDCWIVHVISEKQASSYKGPFVADRSHPLMKGISLEGIIWGAGKTGQLPGTPVISVGNIPVLTDAVQPSGTHRIYLRLNPELSTICQTTAWPSLIWNLLNWRISELPGLQESNVRVGTEVLFVPEAGTDEVSLTLPGKKSRTVNVINGKAVIEPEQPGVYTVISGSRKFFFAANVFSAEESDLTTCSSGKWGNWAKLESSRQAYRHLAWIFLLLAVSGLFVHQVLICRGN